MERTVEGLRGLTLAAQLTVLGNPISIRQRTLLSVSDLLGSLQLMSGALAEAASSSMQLWLDKI